MFSPRDADLARGWPGKIEGDKVIQLAAQTLPAFFTGGGAAREHAEYALEDVVFRAPVLQPPSIRIFDGDDFCFANPAAVHGPDDLVHMPHGVEQIEPRLRFAAIIGAGVVGGYTLMNQWLAPGLSGAKAQDFAISLGPIVVTPDELEHRFLDWEPLIEHAERNTRLLPGDVIGSPEENSFEPVGSGGVAELTMPVFGTLRNYVA
jgi:2-keto-4-pentenoate hydratase/2-oxohepta-3-ene-1,7-dioic acid hydratase in catechol pathway